MLEHSTEDCIELIQICISYLDTYPHILLIFPPDTNSFVKEEERLHYKVPLIAN